MGGVLGVPVGVPLSESVGDGVDLGFAEGPLTLDESGLTGHFSGVFALVPDSGPKGAQIGAGLCLGDSLGSAVGVFSPSDSDSVLLKESLFLMQGDLLELKGLNLGLCGVDPLFYMGYLGFVRLRTEASWKKDYLVIFEGY